MRSRTVIPPLLLAGLGLAFGLLPLAQGRMFFYWDNAQQHFAQTVFFQQWLRQGTLAQWWPAVGLGFPVLAEGQAASFYPIRVLCALLFSAPAALMWEAALYFATAGLATYFFLREFRIHHWAAFLGAATQMFSGFALIYVRNIALHRSLCLLPLAMFCAERFVRRGSWRAWLSAIGVIALQFLAGHPTFAIVTVVATATYVLLRSLHEGATRFRDVALASRVVAGRLALWAVVAIGGAALAAAQVIPMLLHSEQSHRQGGLTLASASGAAATPRGLGQVLFPYVYAQGDWINEASPAANANPNTTAGMYCGALCLALAPLAIWWRRRWPDPALPLAVSAVVAVGFALGAKTPLFPLLWSLPGMSGMRFPSRFLLWATFCLAALTALGAHKLILVSRARGAVTRKVLPLAMVAVLLAITATGAMLRFAEVRPGIALSTALMAGAVASACLVLMFGKLWPRRALIALAAFALLDLELFRVTGNYARTLPIREATSAPAAVASMEADGQPFRVLALTETIDRTFTTQEVKDYLQADLCTIWGLDSTDAYFSLYLKRHRILRAALERELLDKPGAASAWTSLLSSWNVKYVVAPTGLQFPGWSRVTESGAAAIWQLPETLPRAFLVGQLAPQAFVLNDAWRNRADERLADQKRELSNWGSRAIDAQVLDHVADAALDYSKVAEVPDASLMAPAPVAPAAHVTTHPSGPNEMHLTVDTPAAAYLVVSNSFYPGWTANVNGQPARIYETDWLLMGLPVAPGRSEVALRYQTPGLWTGIIASAATIVLWVTLLMRPARWFGRVVGVRRFNHR